MKLYDKERQELLEVFLNNTFYRDWRETSQERVKLYRGLELQLTSACNLDCVYCYYKNNEKLNSIRDFSKEKVLENLDKFIKYMEINGFFPETIDVFSGEPFIHTNVIFDVIKKIVDYYNNNGREGFIIIPTNMTWITNDETVEQVEEAFNYAESKNCKLHLSASVDGKYMDKFNRPFKNRKKTRKFYTDEFYNKLFSFGSKWKIGFHPMTWANNVEYAINNFLWYQKKFEEYGIPWINIYILEVRNAGWTVKQAICYKNFLKFIMNWALHHKFNGNKKLFIEKFIFSRANMNLFSEFSSHARGIGCSLQTTMGLRLQDLTVNACHRMSYKSQTAFKYIDDNREILKPIPLNLEFYLAAHSYDVTSAPYCQDCLLKYTCSGGCLGSNFESTGDWFTVHPTVCLVLHAKHLAIAEFLVENNIFDDVIPSIEKEKQMVFNKLRQWRYFND